jgi:hypothetical protein
MIDADLWVDTADRIGRHLCETAIWSGPCCTWNIYRFQRHVTTPELIPAGVNIYDGTAGIGLFLAELGRVGQAPDATRTARGALRRALAGLDDEPSPVGGFYAGWPGVVLAAARCAHIWRDDEFADAAIACFARFVGRPHDSPETDLVAGPAGSILALLEAADYVTLPNLSAHLGQLGDILLSRAVRRANGWSWPTTSGRDYDHLVGYAHGSAGISHALRALAFATGAQQYEFAADQAVRYDQTYFDSKVGAWYDLRHPPPPLAPPLDSIQDPAFPAAPPPKLTDAPYASSSWCHGATGIGLARIRALRMLPAAEFRDEIRSAALTAVATDKTGASVYCLCHGLVGNAEFLIEASQCLGQPELSSVAYARAMHGRQQFALNNRRWRTRPDVVGEPSFMTGEAGIGYFYLRLADGTTPSLLAPEPQTARARSFDIPCTPYGECQDRNVEDMFKGSLDLFTSHPVARASVRRRITTASRTMPLHDATVNVLMALQEARDTRHFVRPQLRALKDEYARAALLALPCDSTRAEPAPRETLTADSIQWHVMIAQLSPYAKLVELDGMDVGDGVADGTPDLLLRVGTTVRRTSVSRLVALVLTGCAGQPTAAHDLIALVQASSNVPVDEYQAVDLAVKNVLLAAWRTYVIDLWCVE